MRIYTTYVWSAKAKEDILRPLLLMVGQNDGKDVWEECQYCNGRGYNGKLKGKIVAIDFDGVIASYDGWKGIDEHGNDCLGADILIHELIDKRGNGCG